MRTPGRATKISCEGEVCGKRILASYAAVFIELDFVMSLERRLECDCGKRASCYSAEGAPRVLVEMLGCRNAAHHNMVVADFYRRLVVPI